jgi:tRNA (guanine-N7-)-methyltransferase
MTGTGGRATGRRPDDRPVAFFGRRHGKTLRDAQLAGLERGFAAFGLALDEAAPEGPAALFAAPVSSVHLEIGFGGGEHLLAAAMARPGTGFIGVEPFVNGMARVCAALDQAPLSNIRLYDDDAVRLLEWLPQSSISGVDLFYPDPWPKKKHWKRRFVSPANLDRIARVLEPGGVFRFASDIGHYVNWTLALCDAHPEFDWQASGPHSWQQPFAGWPGTRYEAKALREGRTPAYLTFIRR